MYRSTISCQHGAILFWIIELTELVNPHLKRHHLFFYLFCFFLYIKTPMLVITRITAIVWNMKESVTSSWNIVFPNLKRLHLFLQSVSSTVAVNFQHLGHLCSCFINLKLFSIIWKLPSISEFCLSLVTEQLRTNH